MSPRGVPLRTAEKVVAKSPASSVTPTRVASHPPIRADRLCVFEDCWRPLPKIAVRHEHPFCSTVCCRRWYATELPA
jgi:hypothetical protein